MNFKLVSISILSTVIVLIGYHFLFNQKTYSIAYVDTAKLMNQYKGINDVKKAIEQKAKVLEANMDTLTQELHNDIKKYEKERGKMTEREKQTTEELLGHKQQQFMQYKEAAKNKTFEEEQKLTAEVLTRVNSIISEYGKKNNYTIIFGTSSGNIVYANDVINITDEILKILNN